MNIGNVKKYTLKKIIKLHKQIIIYMKHQHAEIRIQISCCTLISSLWFLIYFVLRMFHLKLSELLTTPHLKENDLWIGKEQRELSESSMEEVYSSMSQFCTIILLRVPSSPKVWSPDAAAVLLPSKWWTLPMSAQLQIGKSIYLITSKSAENFAVTGAAQRGE